MDDYPDVVHQVFKGITGIVNPFIRPFGNSCPVRKLSVDILSYLFECIANSESLPGEAVTDEISGKVYVEHRPRRCRCPSGCACDAMEPPPWFPVCLVCRDWYDIAASTPSLWTNIVISPRSRHPFIRVAKQLERSKDLPIDIRIIFQRIRDYAFPSSYRSFCNLLLTKIYHWRSLEVRVGDGGIMHEILDAIFDTGLPIRATRLTSIVLFRGWAQHTECNTQAKRSVLFGLSAPRLNTIFLQGMGVYWDQNWITSASHLRTLNITTEDLFPSWTAFATIVRGAPRLEVLVLRNSKTPDDPDWVDPRLAGAIPIELLRLKSLDINLQMAVTVQFIRRCYMPRLTELKSCFWPVHGRKPEELEAVIAQLVAPSLHARSSGVSHTPRSLLAGLERLRLDLCRDYTAEHVNAMYRHLDRLTSLSLHGISVSSAFVDLLFTPTGRRSGAKLPNLKTLTMWPMIMYDWEVRRVFALAWHRKDIGVPLKALSLCGLQSDVPKACLSWCEDNLEAFQIF